ncbi:legumain-like [Colossoma macropomum]|uniref:legumain-like n=1 Tax=Colossoma macropomum TaxID=42526 RepID=UPI00186559B9|nr:legumain-like [Colossoma macropomum]
MGGTQSKWVLLAAGSKGWENYRHQACVCNAYQMVHANGIPDEQIVVMMYDDIAHHEKNRGHKGEIINEPKGPNVYNGVLKDYIGADVSVNNFLAVLRGDESGVTKCAGGQKKVLKSGKNDTIFIYLSSHGGKGVLSFPEKDLHASDLVDTINKMSGRQQFAKMVIYVESCNSGSMIADLPKNAQVYGVSASTPDEPSCACFFDEDRCTYLSNEFTAYWLLHSKMSNLTRTTFQDQFDYLGDKVSQSTPCQYGNNELSKLFISIILGCPDSRTQAAYANRAKTFKLTHLTPSHEVLPIILRKEIQRETDPEKWRALERDYFKLLQDDCCVLSQMHVFASLIDSGVKVAKPLVTGLRGDIKVSGAFDAAARILAHPRPWTEKCVHGITPALQLPSGGVAVLPHPTATLLECHSITVVTA